MRKQLAPALVALVAFTALCGVLYPLVVTGVAQVAFSDAADGSLVERDGRVIGSSLVGQSFTEAKWFRPRPSAAGDGYDGLSSGPSNLGPTNDELLDAIDERIDAYRAENGLSSSQPVPPDAVTASGSGLDPHISPENARLQAPRVARARGLGVADVLALVEDHTDDRVMGVLGDARVNVLELNLALDAAG